MCAVVAVFNNDNVIYWCSRHPWTFVDWLADLNGLADRIAWDFAVARFAQGRPVHVLCMENLDHGEEVITFPYSDEMLVEPTGAGGA